MPGSGRIHSCQALPKVGDPLLHKVQASPEQRNSEQSTHPPNTQDLTRRLKTPVAPLVQNAAIFEKRVAHHA